MNGTYGLSLVLGLGVTVGLMTAVWSLMTGGTVMLALLGYSVGGTSAALLGAVYVATAPEVTRTGSVERI
ncbi:MAG: hypothetical protein AAF566_14300 [Pseudomonadota bacterium]